MATDLDRRLLLGAAAATGAALLVRGAGATEKKGDKVSPTEDLMREHGVVRRVAFVYDEAIRRMGAKESVPADALADAARIVREFIEDYHERNEEEFVFPRVQKSGGEMASLVTVLLAQHRAGRKLTDEVTRLAMPSALESPAGAQELTVVLIEFDRMYRAHAAREDTVLFPAFRAAAGPKEAWIG